MATEEYFRLGDWDADAVRRRQRELVDTTLDRTPRELDYLSGPLDPDLVSTYERTFGIELPLSYRAFLLQVGDGGIGPGLGIRDLGRPLDDAAPWESGDIATDEGEPDFLMRSGFDPLGAAALDPTRPPYYTSGVRYLFDHGCGLWDVLVVDGTHAGQIFHDARPDRTGLFRYALDDEGALAQLEAEAGASSLDFADYYCWWLSHMSTGHAVG